MAQRIGVCSDSATTQVGWTSRAYNITTLSTTGFTMTNVGYSVPNNLCYVATGYVA